ncbi:hypothetical protein CAEBREN_16127 [Caenorhabditis brenneri]|uniref:Uncharacterized protein n=1 Tax=Caenorhabditis brenneri TaxID=135651 RepID=G0NW17_CAEBE|nr:hypothetical protein CAEBREN_12272 [Caenorhabditis brenneri]EGT55976.1 hypothetical protein CAEBREN_16127 [Caenorhabditis brenneri]
MHFVQFLLLVVLISATLALPFFNSPTGQTYGGQWRQMYTDENLEVPQNPRYIMSNRMRG